MHMNMRIIMYMNIYITKGNEDWLRQQGVSMSGIINRLVEKERGVSRLGVAKENFEEALEDWPKSNINLGPVKPRKGYSFSKNDSGVVTSVIGDLKAAENDGIDIGKKEKLCKTHGLPAMANGKCLQKGCKK